MLRSVLLFACLLGFVAGADAATMGTAFSPKGRILPGNHRPVYKRYGHHGLFEKNLFSGFRRNGKALPSKHGLIKKRRGTL
ncbi:hypothetical protein I2I05_04115 [Hymenobacter sp. BT683]|uniref:Uncharacterized protein n=1 Tax=Hymenobacter jeongseonensis TaxID=2791027 RepID=A0ABS0IDZ0_9BACT|nr:hypothetical protein [Hymenobacter jeongseonensis]MBF9236574.1 hypothetical protein [Hymenobacter jeongseonensis]